MGSLRRTRTAVPPPAAPTPSSARPGAAGTGSGPKTVPRWVHREKGKVAWPREIPAGTSVAGVRTRSLGFGRSLLRGPRPARPFAGAEPIRVFGNTHGLKAHHVKQLERLAERRLPANRLLTHDFARQLTELSREVRRQVGVLVDRSGAVTHVMVGDPRGIELPDW